MTGIELRHVRKQFGATVAVEDLNLVVRAGEFLSLLGPSGCGKTTTLRMVAGLEYPDKGDILINEQRIKWKTCATYRGSAARQVNPLCALL